MDDIFSFNVDSEEFDKILSGTKTAQIFVNDKAHNIYCTGTIIKFITGDYSSQKQVQAVVDSVLYFPTVTEALESVGRDKCGFKVRQSFESANDDFLAGESYENIEKFGVGVMLFSIKK